MAKIEGFRVKNFNVLKDVTLGRVWSKRNRKPLTVMTAVIGKNGVGKSALIDAFGFLADALKSGVEDACNQRGRGGFQTLRSQGQTGPIEFEVYYRESSKTQPITYEIAVGEDHSGRPYVWEERLRQGPKGRRSFHFLYLKYGRGMALKGIQTGYQIDEKIEQIDLASCANSITADESSETETVELRDGRQLGITSLGALKQHPRISDFRQFIEGWYLSYFRPDAARSLPLAGPQPHLNTRGDNLGNVVQFMEREHPRRFKTILNGIADKIPGIDRIDTEKTTDGRLVLRFNDKGFTDPFYAQQVSDGTLKVFAYLLLLEDPKPPPFLCIEEPENGLYHKLLETLANEFRDHTSSRGNNRSQVFVTTHQPYFVDALDPAEVWILEKGEEGFSTIRRASDDPIVGNMVAEGLPLGGLWYSDYLDAR